MSPRVLMAGITLASASTLVAQAVSYQPNKPIQPPGKPADADSLELPAGTSVVLTEDDTAQGLSLRLPVAGLSPGIPWTALAVESTTLTIIRTPVGAESYITVFGSSPNPVTTWVDDEMEIQVAKAEHPHGAEVLIDHEPVGRLAWSGPVTLNAPDEGTLLLELPADLFSFPSGDLSASSIDHASLRALVLSEFDRLAQTKQGKSVLKDDTFVSFETAAAEKREMLAALMSSRTHCVFLDWEFGDDTNDGFSADSAGRSGRGPKKSWQAAMTAAPAGGVIVVSGGVYSYDDIQLTQPKDLSLITLGSVIMSPTAKRDEMLASGLLKQGAAGLEITPKYLNISAE